MLQASYLDLVVQTLRGQVSLGVTAEADAHFFLNNKAVPVTLLSLYFGRTNKLGGVFSAVFPPLSN